MQASQPENAPEWSANSAILERCGATSSCNPTPYAVTAEGSVVFSGVGIPFVERPCTSRGLCLASLLTKRTSYRRRDTLLFQFPAQQGWPIPSTAVADHSLLTPETAVSRNHTHVDLPNVTSIATNDVSLHTACRSPSSSHATSNERRLGYLGELSLLSFSSSCLPRTMGLEDKSGDIINEKLLIVTDALSLPPLKMTEALTECYFKHLFYRMAIVDLPDTQTNILSPLLSQGICLAGSLLRYQRTSSLLECPEVFYVKAKTLLSIGHEKNKLTIVQSLCFLALWNPTPPTVVSLDGPWHWMGIAMRLALQMGIHRESTCSRMTKSGLTRRIAWYLFVQDKIQAASYGRPPYIGHHDFDVRALQLDDFESCNDQAKLYIEYINLGTILGEMVKLQSRKDGHCDILEEAIAILHSLGTWISKLPVSIRLFDAAGQKRYRRDVYEIHIIYFAYIVIFFHLFGHTISSAFAPLTALVASSSMAQLYEEMNWRDDTSSLLSVHLWYIMAAAIPQIHCNRSIYDHNGLCLKELDIFTALLGQALTKWPTAEQLLKKIDLLLSGQGPGTAHVPFEDCTINYGNIPVPTILALFPFPDSLCPRMGLLKQITSQPIDFIMEAARVLRDDDWDRIMGQFFEGQ